MTLQESCLVSQAIGRRYALIVPVRDEEKFVGAMIDSILAQTVRPVKWIFVDDGSTDQTPEIVSTYGRQFKFVELVRMPSRSHRMPGGEGAISAVIARLNVADYDFIARFDADLIFKPDYIANMLSEFERDPKLGIAGGGLYSETNGALRLENDPESHVRGALKMYRRQCFEDIGGLTTQIGWDTIDEVYAWIHGWKTRSFYQYEVLHRRPTGGSIAASRIYRERGKAEYLTWSSPLFVGAKALKLAVSDRSLTKVASYAGGFLSCYAARLPRFHDPTFRKTRRAQQLRRLASLPVTIGARKFASHTLMMTPPTAGCPGASAFDAAQLYAGKAIKSTAEE